MTKRERTERELKRGLVSWVEGYRLMRSYGNVGGAIQIRDDIDRVVQIKRLDRDLVYGTEEYHRMKRGGA